MNLGNTKKKSGKKQSLFEWLCFLFHDLLNILCGERQLSFSQFWSIERFQELVVERR